MREAKCQRILDSSIIETVAKGKINKRKWKFDQLFYSILSLNFHYQDIQKEMNLLSSFLHNHKMSINSAIDIGCGNGEITEKLGELFDIDAICGLDLNKKLLCKAKDRGIQTIYGDMDLIDLKVKFDLAISYGSLHHFEDTNNLISKMKKISSKYILIVDNTVRGNLIHRMTGSRYFPFESSEFPIRTENEIIRALKQAGCGIVAVKTISNANFWHDRSFFLACVN